MKKYVICAIFSICLLLVHPVTISLATTTNAGITFIEESTENTDMGETITEESSTEELSTEESSTEETNHKDLGKEKESQSKFPITGENQSIGKLIIGGIILLTSLVLIILRKKSNQQS